MSIGKVNARFVGGSGRCGTALLGSVFAAHPDTTYFREPFFLCGSGGLCDYVQGRASLPGFKQRMLIFRRNLIKKTVGARAVYSEEVIKNLVDATMFDEDRVTDGRRFVEALFSLMDTPYWVEKTPHTVRFADVLYLMFPNMRYVHIIRDPKDVFASLKEQHWGPKKVDKFVAWYMAIMNQALQAKGHTPAENYKTVSLEGLVNEPYQVLESILNFMEIPFEAGWLEPLASEVDRDKAHIGRHKRDLTPAERREIDARCGGLYWLWQAGL